MFVYKRKIKKNINQRVQFLNFYAFRTLELTCKPCSPSQIISQKVTRRYMVHARN